MTRSAEPVPADGGAEEAVGEAESAEEMPAEDVGTETAGKDTEDKGGADE